MSTKVNRLPARVDTLNEEGKIAEVSCALFVYAGLLDDTIPEF